MYLKYKLCNTNIETTFLVPYSTRHLSSNNCLADNRENYQNYLMLYCVPRLYPVIRTFMSRWTRACWFSFLCVFACVFPNYDQFLSLTVSFWRDLCIHCVGCCEFCYQYQCNRSWSPIYLASYRTPWIDCLQRLVAETVHMYYVSSHGGTFNSAASSRDFLASAACAAKQKCRTHQWQWQHDAGNWCGYSTRSCSWFAQFIPRELRSSVRSP